MTPFGEWMPDRPAYNNPGATLAKNVVPQIDHYTPLRSLSSLTDAIANVCLGSFWVRDDTGLVHNFSGDANNLYRLNLGNWTNVGGGFNAVNWEFIRWGQRIIAASPAQQLQYYDLGVSATFQPLPNAPQPSRIAVVRDHILGGDVPGEPSKLVWSGYNNSEVWAPNLAAQSGEQPLGGRGGAIQRLVPGDGHAIVFQEHSIRIASYVGSPIIFDVGQEIERGRGTPAPNSVCWTGQHTFYYGQDGFYAFNQGSTPIGANRIDAWFRQNSSDEALPSMRGAVDRHNRLVIWAYKSTTAAPINDRLMIYNWAADKWSHAEMDTEVIAEYLTEGLTLDQISEFSDAVNVLSDSDTYEGGRLSLALFGPDHRLGVLSGEILPGEFETLEVGDMGSQTVRSVRPIIDGPATVAYGTRKRQQDEFNFTIPQPVTADGEVTRMSNARYHRFRVKTQGEWSRAQGVDVDMAATGRY